MWFPPLPGDYRTREPAAQRDPEVNERIRFPQCPVMGAKNAPMVDELGRVAMATTVEHIPGSIRAPQPPPKGPTMETSLHELFPNDWEPHQPARLSDLLTADYDTLDNRARGVRALLVEAIHGFERAPVLTAAHCRELLEKHHLPKPRNRWALVALNAKRERVYVKTSSGGMRMASSVKDYFPTAAVAGKDLTLPDGGVYLAVYGGSVDILEDEKALARARDLTSSFPLADVVVWDDDGTTAKFWSVAAATGVTGSTETDFPNPDLVLKWKELLCNQ
jgi:hypothetical protein